MPVDDMKVWLCSIRVVQGRGSLMQVGGEEMERLSTTCFRQRQERARKKQRRRC